MFLFRSVGDSGVAMHFALPFYVVRDPQKHSSAVLHTEPSGCSPKASVVVVLVFRSFVRVKVSMTAAVLLLLLYQQRAVYRVSDDVGVPDIGSCFGFCCAYRYARFLQPKRDKCICIQMGQGHPESQTILA